MRAFFPDLFRVCVTWLAALVEAPKRKMVGDLSEDFKSLQLELAEVRRLHFESQETVVQHRDTISTHQEQVHPPYP